MSARWWLYVGAFLAGIALVVTGLIQANTTLTFLGVIIGAVLFLTRKYVR